MTASSADRLRRRTTGVALVAFPLTMLAAAVVQPVLGEQAAEVYDAAAADPGRLAASVAIGAPGVLLWIIAVVGAVHLVRGRGARLAHVGGTLALIGALAHMVMATLLLVLLGIPHDGDRADLVPVVDRIAGHVFPVAMPMLVLGGLGLVLLAFALWRAQRAPVATPALLVAAFVSEFVPLGGPWTDLVLWLLAGSGLAVAGVRVLGMDDSAWSADAGAVHQETRGLPVGCP